MSRIRKIEQNKPKPKPEPMRKLTHSPKYPTGAQIQRLLKATGGSVLSRDLHCSLCTQRAVRRYG